MAIDRSRYRVVNYIGARILEDRELNKQQKIERLVDDNNAPAAYELGALYRDGATLNVSVGIVGTTVSLSPTDATKPMLVFVRGAWEMLKTAEAPPTVVTGTKLFLNYSVVRRTMSDDPQLVDSTTGGATAEMGELVLSVSATDNSVIDAGVALLSTELERNLHAIVLFNFASGVLVPTDNVLPQANANSKNSGLVKLTTDTAAGVAVSTDDPRMSDGRYPLANSVQDSSVRTPTAAGTTNADGTPTYSIGTDPGGISATKIVLQASTQLLSDAWAWLVSGYNSLLSAFNSHQGANIGLANTHPMPTPAQVGAAPASHVGQILGLPTSHPPVISANSGGFTCNRDNVAGSNTDYSFSTVKAGTPVNGLTHGGDVYSSVAAAVIASPVGTTTTGPLGLMGVIAHVLAEHVNQTSHANPHGLAPGDIGAATTSYVDTAVANVLAQAENFTSSSLLTYVTVRQTNFVGASHFENVLGVSSPNNTQMHWVIVTFGKFQIAFGNGFCYSGDTVIMPDNDNSWPLSQMMVSPSVNWAQQHYDSDRTGVLACQYNGGNNTVFVYSTTNGHTPLPNEWANVSAMAWRINP